MNFKRSKQPSQTLKSQQLKFSKSRLKRKLTPPPIVKQQAVTPSVVTLQFVKLRILK
jgi:hypothetical protein